MSTNTRITRSNGKSDGLSLLAMSRPRRKPTNTENDDEDTILNTTFDAGSSQRHPQMPIHTSPLRCQSMPPQTGSIRMQETPVPAVPAAPQKPITPHIPLPTSPNSGSHLSQLSAPLFYRRQVQFNLRRRIRSGHRSDTDQQKKQAQQDIHA